MSLLHRAVKGRPASDAMAALWLYSCAILLATFSAPAEAGEMAPVLLRAHDVLLVMLKHTCSVFTVQ